MLKTQSKLIKLPNSNKAYLHKNYIANSIFNGLLFFQNQEKGKDVHSNSPIQHHNRCPGQCKKKIKMSTGCVDWSGNNYMTLQSTQGFPKSL